jgi:hypothetical protein
MKSTIPFKTRKVFARLPRATNLKFLQPKGLSTPIYLPNKWKTLSTLMDMALGRIDLDLALDYSSPALCFRSKTGLYTILLFHSL